MGEDAPLYLKLLAFLVIIVFASGGLRISSRIRRPLLHVFLCFFRGSLTSLVLGYGYVACSSCGGKVEREAGHGYVACSSCGGKAEGEVGYGYVACSSCGGKAEGESQIRVHRLLVVTRGCSLEVRAR